MVALHLSQDPESDKFVSGNSLGLLIGMVLDQQITIEKAFSSPAELARRLGGTLDAAAIAAMPLDELTEVFRERPALHRYPGSMAGTRAGGLPGDRRRLRRQGGCDLEGGRDGRGAHGPAQGAARLRRPEGEDLHRAAGQAARRRPVGWQEASTPYSGEGAFLSVADITSTETLDKVRANKRALKAKAHAKK